MPAIPVERAVAVTSGEYAIHCWRSMAITTGRSGHPMVGTRPGVVAPGIPGHLMDQYKMDECVMEKCMIPRPTPVALQEP